METEKIKLTLDPSQKEDNLEFGNVPSMKSVADVEMKTNYAAGTIDESMLTDEEKEMVEQFASEINIENVDQIVNYGMKAQTNISDFSS